MGSYVSRHMRIRTYVVKRLRPCDNFRNNLYARHGHKQIVLCSKKCVNKIKEHNGGCTHGRVVRAVGELR